MAAFPLGGAGFVTMTSGRPVVAVRTSTVGAADAVRVARIVAVARRAGMSTVVAAMAAGAMFALAMFRLAIFDLAMFGLTVFARAIATRAAMRAVMTRTIRRTRFVLAVGDAELSGAFRCRSRNRCCGIVGPALRTIATAVIRMAVGTIPSRMFGAIPAGSALESRTATVAFATTSAARCALAARSVVVTTAFRHRQDFAADIIHHDERLLHHSLDGADFAAL